MNHTRCYLLTATALALGHWGAPALASTTAPVDGLEEIPDSELGDMRGRYVAPDNTVAWFGVKMISTWETSSGQVLQSTLALNMDLRTNDIHPVIHFEPSVTVTGTDALPPAATETLGRSVDASGLANGGGVRQSVQVAGDGNQASNVSVVRVREGGDLPPVATNGASSSALPDPATAQSGGASALASFDGESARVRLTVDGQGAVEQWIRGGSIGQSIQLTSDNQWVSNRMEIELVRQSVSRNVQLAQNVAQAIHLARGLGGIQFH